MERLGTTGTTNPGSKNNIQQDHFTSLSTCIKAILVRLAECFSLVGSVLL
jgi:hypothetical protein